MVHFERKTMAAFPPNSWSLLMKRYLIRFGIVAVLFLALDSVWLSQTQEILYRRHLAGILLDGFRVFPALLFYILYVAGIMVFAIEAADASGRVSTAAARGAFFGLVAYGTYDLSNQATLAAWSSAVTAADMAWGTVATALAASVGFVLTRGLFSAKSS
jgi:uncharacterized membrane protein